MATELTTPVTAPDRAGDLAAVQRRILWLLSSTQVIGGVGVATGLSVGALLAADVAGTGISGMVQSTAIVGGALLALPVARIMRQFGRRPGMAAAYFAAACGGVGVVVAATLDSLPLLFVAMFLFGGGTTAGMQARFAAVDLAPSDRRGRHLSLVVWATTLGAVAGPNLSPLAGEALAGTGVPTLAAPFALSAALFALAAVVVTGLLRPDPLRLRQQRDGADERPGAGGLREAWRAVARRPAARLGVASMAVGHLVMVGVMAMTPVHIRDAGHGDAATLRIVGVVLSLHIAGMYALSPVTGWLTDRFGRRAVILGGVGALVAACAVAGTAGHDSARLAIGLTLLGLGWSATMVAGSLQLSDSVPAQVRPSAQGLADVAMGLAGALAGSLAGLVLQWSSYPVLALLAAIATVPLAAAALRPASAPGRGDGDRLVPDGSAAR